MKKALSFFITFAILFCIVRSADFSSLAVGEDLFTHVVGAAVTTTMAGDAEKGYTTTVEHTGQTVFVTKNPHPLKSLAFDFGASTGGTAQGFGLFGFSKNGVVTSGTTKSDSNQLNFYYYPAASGSIMNINLNVNGTAQKIGELSTVNRPGDGYWSPNISNIAVSKVGENWYLTVDGFVCNFSETYSPLNNYWEKSYFESDPDVYIHFGIYRNQVPAGGYKFYFKPTTVLSADRLWQSASIDRFTFMDGGANREYRGQGITTTTVQYGIPGTVTGNENDGHTIQFNNTQGYMQTADPFLLTRDTQIKYKFNPTATDNVLWYYLAFTTQKGLAMDFAPTNVRPNQLIEFAMQSVRDDGGDGRTYAWPQTGGFTYSGTQPPKMAAFKGAVSRCRNIEVTVTFVREDGADGNKHWYMHLSGDGRSATIKSATESEDAILRFDSMMNKNVHFRLGSGQNYTFTGSLWCKIDPGELPILDPAEEAIVDGLLERLDAIGTIDETNYEQIETEITDIRSKWEALSEDGKAYVPETAITSIEKQIDDIKYFINPGDWYLSNRAVNYTGDKWINWSFPAVSSQFIATSSEKYDIIQNSFYWKGINITSAWFSFGLVQQFDDPLLPGNAGINAIAFILTPSNNSLTVQFWDPVTKQAASLETGLHEEFEFYNKAKPHYFSMVKLNGHWYLKIDEKVFSGQHYDVIDNYMEAYGTSTRVRFAGYNSLGACEVNIVDPTVDDTVIPEEIREDVEDFENKVTDLGGIKVITEENADEIEAKINDLLDEYNGLSSRYKKYIKNHVILNEMKRRIELMELSKTCDDWYTNEIDFTYTKSDENSWDFDSVKGIGSRFAATTTPYDATATGLQWQGVEIPSGWFEFGLTSDYTLSPLSGNSKQSIIFILTQSNSDIVVQFWDGDARVALSLETLENAKYTGFDLYNKEKAHTYGFTKKNDGHWYLYIDKKLFDGKYYEAIDNFMETYGTSAYFSFGSYQGTNACNVQLLASEYSDGTVVIDAENIVGTLNSAQKYLQYLEENYVAIWEYDGAVTEKAYNLWKSLDYRGQLDVEGILMDDEYMWDIHEIVITFDPALYARGEYQKPGDTLPDGINPDTADKKMIIVTLCLMAFAFVAVMTKWRKHREN